MVENLLEVSIDFWIKESSIARCGAHWVVKYSTHWNADHSHICSLVRPLWSGSEGVVQHLEHFMIVSNLSVAGRVHVVRLLVRDLVEHGGEPHVSPGVVLNEGFEVLQHRRKLLWILLGMFNLTAEPLPVDSRVGRQPSACLVYSVLIRDEVFVSVLVDHCGGLSYWEDNLR